MPRIFDAQTGQPLGEITEADLAFLRQQLEEESDDDRDYYLNATNLDLFQEAGADPILLDRLRRAMGDRGELEIRWEA
jgi:hypothetical protein